jgi:hypothetical protein
MMISLLQEQTLIDSSQTFLRRKKYMQQVALSRKSVLLFCTLLTLLMLSGAYVVGGMQAFSRFQQNTLANQQHCGGQAPVHICVLSPSAIFSAFYPSYTATQTPLFTITYNSSYPLTLLISVSITDFTQVVTHTVNAESSMQTSTFIPKILPHALLQLTNEQISLLHVQVKDTKGQPYYVDDIALQLHSRRLMQWLQANRMQIAAWVTPDDPAISDLIKHASTHLKDETPSPPLALIGYDNATPEQVNAQVNAIYDSLRLDYHIHYVQASVPYSINNQDYKDVTQIIKLPSEVLAQQSGMCVELTLVLASAVEHIGLNAEIVIIPGHAFLGVADQPDNQHFQYWDAVAVNNNVAADSSNIAANKLYAQNQKAHTLLDTILISDARDARIGPML